MRLTTALLALARLSAARMIATEILTDYLLQVISGWPE